MSKPHTLVVALVSALVLVAAVVLRVAKQASIDPAISHQSFAKVPDDACGNVIDYVAQSLSDPSVSLICTDFSDEEDQKLCAAAPPHGQPEPFGALLGERDGVRVFSSNYVSLAASPLVASSLVSSIGGVFTGCRYQCVELARRYLIETRGVTFGPVDNAVDIFDLATAHRVNGGADVLVPLKRARNGAPGIGLPRPGSLLIWSPGVVVGSAGHVAVVVAAAATHVDIIEQNWDDVRWPEGRPYSRRLRARLREGGEFTIFDSVPRTAILGWVAVEGT